MTEDTRTSLADRKREFAERAAASLMILSVSIGKWEGITRLKKGAAKAAEDAGANPSAFRGYVNLLGQHHAQLGLVKRAYSAVRTFLYRHSLPFGRGDYLFPVARIPEVLQQLDRLQRKAEDTLEDFLLVYNQLRTAALSHDMGSWQAEVRGRYPTTAEVRQRFYIKIDPPQAIPYTDVGKYALPGDLAARIAAASAERLTEQLEAAKTAAMATAQTRMATLATQLDAGVKLRASLISNARQAAQVLRDMTECYDNDPRIRQLADMMDRAVDVESPEVWKTFDSHRQASITTAQSVVSGIKKLSAAIAADNKTPPTTSAIVGGVLGDMI